jgi:hypothetical protein
MNYDYLNFRAKNVFCIHAPTRNFFRQSSECQFNYENLPLFVVEDDVSDADEDGNDVGDGVEADHVDHVEAVEEEIDAEHNRHQRPRRQMRPVVPNYRLSHQGGQFRFRNSRHVAKP